MVTSPKYLLDSDIVIAMLRDRKDVSGLRHKALSVGLDHCYVSSITLAELYSGAFRMASERGLHEVAFIKTIFNILPFGGQETDGVDAAAISGRTKSLLLAAGRPLADIDILLGATAVSEGLIMVTHNTRHFSRIPDITLEDWLDVY